MEASILGTRDDKERKLILLVLCRSYCLDATPLIEYLSVFLSFETRDLDSCLLNLQDEALVSEVGARLN